MHQSLCIHIRNAICTLVMAYKQRFISNDFETSQIFEKIKQHYPNFRKKLSNGKLVIFSRQATTYMSLFFLLWNKNTKSWSFPDLL